MTLEVCKIKGDIDKMDGQISFPSPASQKLESTNSRCGWNLKGDPRGRFSHTESGRHMEQRARGSG